MSSKWTQEQIDAMMELADVGISLEEASSAMIATGWEKRTVPSLRSKYRSYTGSNWPTGKPHVSVNNDVEDTPVNLKRPTIRHGLIILTLLVGVAVIYGWFY